MVQCKYCQREFRANQFLSMHIRNTHKKTWVEYIKEFTILPKCKCGCGQEVPLKNHGTVIAEYVHGHNKSRLGMINSPEHRYASAWNRGKHHTLETRNKISASVVKAYKEGRKYHTGSYYSSKMKKIFYYRSTWERMFMERLDEDNTVEGWRYEEITIPYEFEGISKRYVPDFLVRYTDGSRAIIEIGQRALKKQHPLEMAKIEAGKKFCETKGWDFQLKTDEDFGR